MVKIPTVNQKLLEKYIRHSVYLEQLKKGEAKLISQYLGKEIFPKLHEKLINELGKVKNLETLGSISKFPAQRLTKMMLSVRKTAQAGSVKAEQMLINRLVNVSKFEAKWNADLISKTVPIDIDMTMPSNEVLKQLITTRTMDGAKLGTWMKGYSASLNASMMKAVKVGIATGESLPNIGKRIESALGYKTKQAEYIARTAVSNVVHQAREEVFKKNTDIVKEVQWVSTLDDRTSDICIALDGKIFPVGEGERPPAHFNCRSTVVPVLASWNEFGVEAPPAATRASMDGAVPAKTTYKEWLKDLGKTAEGRATQETVLGKTKAEWFRKNPSIITKFVDKDLRPLTIEQIAKREGISLEKVLPALPVEVKAVTVSKVGTTFTKTISEEFKSVVDKTIDAYPEKVKVALNDGGISYKSGQKLTEVFPELKGQHPRGWPAGSTWDSVSGAFHGPTNSISINETYRPIGQKVFVKTSAIKIKGVLNHETGHGFDRSGHYSWTEKFKIAYKEDRYNLSQTNIIQNNLRYYLQPGGAGRSEVFAETFGNIMGQGAGERDISKYFPGCKKYVEGLLK